MTPFPHPSLEVRPEGSPLGRMTLNPMGKEGLDTTPLKLGDPDLPNSPGKNGGGQTATQVPPGPHRGILKNHGLKILGLLHLLHQPGSPIPRTGGMTHTPPGMNLTGTKVQTEKEDAINPLIPNPTHMLSKNKSLILQKVEKEATMVDSPNKMARPRAKDLLLQARARVKARLGLSVESAEKRL